MSKDTAVNIHTCPRCGQTRYETEDEKDERAVRGRRKTGILLLLLLCAFVAGVVVGGLL